MGGAEGVARPSLDLAHAHVRALCLFCFAFQVEFASKPNMIIKNGLPAWGVVGDPGATVSNAQPLVIGPQFGAFGVTAEDLGVHFTNEKSQTSPSRRRSVPVRNTRSVRGSDMLHHGILGEIAVDHTGHVVTFNGQHITSDPQNAATLTRTYLL